MDNNTALLNAIVLIICTRVVCTRFQNKKIFKKKHFGVRETHAVLCGSRISVELPVYAPTR